MPKPENQPNEALEWSVNLGDVRPERRYVVIFFALFMLLAGVYLFRSIVLGLIGFVVVFAATLEMFVPVRYRIDESGVQSRNGISTTRIEWGDVKRTWEDGSGVYLSPLAQPSRLDQFRGVHLRFASNREAVLVKISDHLENDVESVVGGVDSGRTERSGGEGRDDD
ncbi:MAG: hypothetical protein KF812_02590, partial [Fimbriimonadaceae bacterium]|nr:hypothetical protein [Fimbriimonadaceae bacterium]